MTSYTSYACFTHFHRALCIFFACYCYCPVIMTSIHTSATTMAQAAKMQNARNSKVLVEEIMSSLDCFILTSVQGT